VKIDFAVLNSHAKERERRKGNPHKNTNKTKKVWELNVISRRNGPAKVERPSQKKAHGLLEPTSSSSVEGGMLGDS